jgi:hypothetical protein
VLRLAYARHGNDYNCRAVAAVKRLLECPPRRFVPSPRLRGAARGSVSAIAWPVLLLIVSGAPAAAQTLPAGPVSALDGRLGVGAEVVATIGDRDNSAFFNYTDYEHNVLRMFRLALAAAWRPVEPVAFVAEVRTEDFDQVRPYAAYVRVRPWRSHELDFQIGRIPPTFGSFGRRTYGMDNPLIGYPLALQYLTSLRPDAIPATVDDLLNMRGRGWRTAYPVGSPIEGPGLPLISGFRWDTGVQARWRNDRIELSGAVTAGTLSDPQVGDNNSGKQLSGRVALQPATGLTVGGSAARGEWLDNDVMDLLPASAPGYTQTALGGDFEYSRDYWLVRGEVVWSRWELPFAALGRSEKLDALGSWIEGRYRFTPRIFLAGRLDRLAFSKIADEGGQLVTWDAPVTRAEAVIGYYIQRNLVVRAAVQYNDRDGGRIPQRTYFAGQIAYWF